MTPEPDNQKTSVPEPTVSVGGGALLSRHNPRRWPTRFEEKNLTCFVKAKAAREMNAGAMSSLQSPRLRWADCVL